MQDLNQGTTERMGKSLSKNRAPVIAALGLAVAAVAGAAFADDINVHPASCQAPFLDQAFPMRWHEYFLMNPTTGVTTWVICPIPFDSDGWTPGDTLDVEVTGGRMVGASGELPICIFSVHDEDNLDQGGYVIGPRDVFDLNLPVTLVGSIWNGTSRTTFDSIDNALIGSKDGWAASIRCRLPIGYGISQINITD